jgi:subtilisin family serine protease
MDPNAWELYEGGAPEDEVSVIIRMAPGSSPPAAVRVVARFGDIATGRLRRGDILATRQSPGIVSLKAGSLVTPPPFLEDSQEPGSDAFDEGDEPGEIVEPNDYAEAAPPAAAASADGDGRGVVVGICDWGFDFTHANFRNADGTTRLLCLWDQRGVGDPLAPPPYNVGKLFTREMINAALRAPDPPAALGYHPASGDPTNTGSHGTHVADILAGNRREPGSSAGIASGSDLVFVHLGSQKTDELGNLGDSIGLLEGLDMVRRQAAGRPCVMHLSAGKTGGPHRGDTLLERAVDTMLKAPSLVLVQSVGNYANTAMHTHARVGPDQKHTINWITPPRDRTPNELEIWYSGHDVFDVTLTAPTGQAFSVALDNRLRLEDAGAVWGNFYHRLHEPNSGLNHIVVYLYTAAPSGTWQVVLHGRDVVDGRLHAWIERDAGSRYQSRFPRSQATTPYTTNTICNCFKAIAVGAFDGTRQDRPPTIFSSRGPTADGRQKPEIAAPGYKILAARSLPKQGWQGERRLCVKSGTSMAAPVVSGTVALMMAAAGRPLSIHEIRRALIGSVDPHPGPTGRSSTQLGYGYVNTSAAVAAARRIGAEAPAADPSPRQSGEDVDPLDVAVELMRDDLIAPPEQFDDAPEQERVWPEAVPAEMVEDCGCRRRKPPAQEHEQEHEQGDEAYDDVTPFSWEDVRDAAEALAEIEKLDA